MFVDFLNLIFPQVCFSCEEVLGKKELDVCLSCQVNLPKTDFHLEKENKVSELFFGRVNIEMAASFYYFNRANRVQHLLHQLKYKGAKELGETLGSLYGKELVLSDHYKGIDFIIPVPLHSKKRRKRGYNQSEWIARGLSSSMGLPVNETCLKREYDNVTQTNIGRYERWKNVQSVFEVFNPEVIQGKNILLVDDIVTTGATLEACSEVLKKSGCEKVYIATIACA